MKIEKKELEKSQIELTVELSVDEFKPYLPKAAEKISREVKVDGFRPGKIPYDVLKGKIGEMSILEAAARIAINKTLTKAIDSVSDRQPIGRPDVNITKLAPNNPVEYKIILAILPEITMGDYKNAKVKLEKTDVKEEEVDKALEQLREMRAKEVIVEREIKTGDKVLANIEMFLDSVPVEGGQNKDTAIIIGKNYIIPGFDKKLIGAKKKEERDFSLPYPKDHHMANLAGKMVEFKVKINEIYERELPELDEEFVKNFGLKNKEDLKNNIKKSMTDEKKQKAEEKTEIEMLDKIISKTKFGDIPELLINNEVETMLSELEHNINNQGGKFDDYLKSIKKTRDQLKLDLLPNAIKRVKSALLIQEISRKEKIEASEKEIEAEVEKLLKQYKGYEKVESRVKEPGYKAYLHNTLTSRKVVSKLKEWNMEKG